jgi:hypothetical protein
MDSNLQFIAHFQPAGSATPRSGIRNEFRLQSARPSSSSSKFFQNSATPFHALLAFLLLLAIALPAFSQIPAKVALSRAHTPVAYGFTVAWSDLSNETAYHLEHATSANFTGSTLITNISANATSHALTGLTPNTTYYVRVRGVAAGGNGTWSDVQANQLLSLDPGQTRYLSVAGVPHGASHSVNFTISDVFGSANAAALASGTTPSEASTIMLLGANGSTAHTIFYNSSQNQWREGATNKGSEIVGFGKGFIVRNNTGSADIFLLSGAVPPLEPGAVTVFDPGAPAGRLGLVTPSKTTPTSLSSLGLTYSNNTTTGLKRATIAKDADLLLIPDNSGGLKRYHFDGTHWRSGLRTVPDPTAVTVPAGGAFFLRKATGSSFEQWRRPLDIVTDGLVLHLDAGNPDSYPGNGTTWTDLSGNGNSGNLTNGPTFSSVNGGGIVFDGSNDFVNCGNATSINITGLYLTISTWIRSRTFKSNAAFIHKEQQYTFAFINDKLSYADSSDWSYARFGSHGAFSTNVWYNVVAVKNNTDITLYSNASVVISKTFGSAISSRTSNLSIGSYTGTTYSTADIAQVSIYNRALTPAEVQQNYNATKRRFEDPDATAYLNAVEAADGQALEPDVRDAVDKFVKGCKADGIWTAIKASCILAGARTLNGALTPLVGTAPTNVGGNFVSADYHRENGLQGGGSKYLDTNRDNNADPQNNKHYSVHIHTVHASDSAGTYIGYTSITSGASGVLRSAANPANIQFRINDNTVNNVAGGTATGFVGASRSNSSGYVVRYSSGNTTANVASQTPAIGNFRVLSGLGFGCNGRVQFYSIGESLDLAKLDSRVTTLMADLAAAIP